jgi:hypothetical protein
MKVAAIIIGLLLAASAPALAKDSAARKSAAKAAERHATHKVEARERAAKTHLAARSVEHAGSKHHHKDVKASQKHDKERETGTVAMLERDTPAAPASFPADVGWRLIEDPATGARLGLPEKLVPHAGASRTGSRWTSAQGQIQIETFRLTEAALPALFEEEKKASRRQVASSQLKPDSFIIAGIQGLKNFLIRAVARGGEVRGVAVLYDQATEGRMERIGAATVSAFTGFPDPHASPLPGVRRMVEYGTAIVVSSNGDLIASGHVTDDCQAITLPGLGHAERIAVDKTNDLALIRVYGARNLVPAMLAGDGGRASDLNLVGVADPLAQAGTAEVTSATARLTSQGVEPAPKLGFSGAAAVDARGALAGMVDLKPPVVAGNGSIPQGATLVPVEAIRAFMQARGITPEAVTAGHAAMEQSVVRVVCVRK